MHILGISAFYHDSAACLVRDGEIIAAAQEERFTRKKHDPGFPHRAVEYCLNEGRIGIKDLQYIVFYDKPLIKFERLLETYVGFAPRGIQSFLAAMPVWLKEKLLSAKPSCKESLGLRSWRRIKSDLPQFLFGEHHESHAASAFYPIPLSKGRCPLYGWSWGVGDDLGLAGRWAIADPSVGHSVSSFDRSLVFSIYLLHGIQSQLR